MKKLIAICYSVLFLWSCSLDTDNSTNYNFEFLPVESVEMPEVFIHGDVYSISYTYYRPSTCHSFHDLYYYADGNERTIAIINIVYDENNCEWLTDELMERSFNFKPLEHQTYVFKFWQGQDEYEEDMYLTYEVPVVY